jgi:hypothetical protein
MARRKTRQQADSTSTDEAHGPADSGGEESMTTDTDRQMTAGPEAAGPEGANGAGEGPHGRGEAPAHGMVGDGEASTMDRAEEMVDRLAQKVAHYTSAFGRALLRLGARAREEAEDIWAEAQNIRRGGQG